ncbi:uncharacterized protein LOC107361690 isoform X5 [Tetranychus urticae]|uniref:uncharacterized protein LOC107361690 isoform X5 n=1 Tax=Tetranychus urticae TaxID=32264 RepID=UPI000D643E62|nr:uncharacterized protein LOC107361690 isoform X5 [Tetranychus urticae]
MLINELPDDFLMAIFEYVNDLDDLINCYKVCTKWSHLIPERTKKVKYFMEDPGYASDYVYYQGRDLIDGTCLSTLFPSLIMAEFSFIFDLKAKFEDTVAFVRNQESLKALMIYKETDEYCDKLEMLSLTFVEKSFLRNVSSVKQLYILYAHLDFFSDAHYFQNLERLHILLEDKQYDGPVLEKLKVVELGFTADEKTNYYGFQFMDSCPNLQSAHISVQGNLLCVNETLKHERLQDLVLHFMDQIEWDGFEGVFRKYPNLKHLRLKGKLFLQDENIEQLVNILPNLVLLDVSGCIGLPIVSNRAADYVTNYCARHGRSIKFYYDENRHEIKSDWPQLSTKIEKISRGFDFMKHCFLKKFKELPFFLIPIDY